MTEQDRSGLGISRRRLLLLVDLDDTGRFEGRVDVVGARAGGSFAGWIDFMALVEAALPEPRAEPAADHC